MYVIVKNAHNRQLPLDIKLYTHLLPCYRVLQKLKFVEAVPKMEGSATICAHQNAIKSCSFRKCFGGFL